MQTANEVKYPHDNNAGCNNALPGECPFGIQVSKNVDVVTGVPTGRVYGGVPLNQNGGADFTVQSVEC